MKKLIALLSLTALCVMTFGPVLTVATTNGIGTSLTQDVSGDAPPRVLVSWIARGDDANNVSYPSVLDYYRDDHVNQYSQINPSGIFEEHRTIAMCSIVESDFGIDYIYNVYADVFYPINIGLGEHHTPIDNQSGDGCGKFMQQDKLSKLSKQNGIDLFCGNVRGLNNNLPVWGGYYETYETLCGSTGKLHKDEATVYCGTKMISYEDPNGYYKVMTLVLDNGGLSGTHDHGFTYQSLMAYEVDFASVAYGQVKLNTTKNISGDLTFGTADKPTVRNIGNTRLQMRVWQDDMGLGSSSGVSNVRYGARVGHEVGFTGYNPESWTYINDELDLSETNEMDFSILVKKFPYPNNQGSFTGTMELDSRVRTHLTCDIVS